MYCGGGGGAAAHEQSSSRENREILFISPTPGAQQARHLDQQLNPVSKYPGQQALLCNPRATLSQAAKASPQSPKSGISQSRRNAWLSANFALSNLGPDRTPLRYSLAR